MPATRAMLIPMALMLLIGPAAAAQDVPDLTGAWTLNSSAQLPDGGLPCVFAGQATIVQNGTEISGTARQTLSSGPAACPVEMMAELSGFFDPVNRQVSLQGSMIGQLGTASFTGEISRETGGGGGYAVSAGPFADLTGTWSAALQQQQREPIPVATPVGLTVLVLLLLGLGALALRQQRPV